VGGDYQYNISQSGATENPLLAAGSLALHLSGTYMTPSSGLSPGQPSQSAGTDGLGAWTALSVPWTAGALPLTTTWRCYAQAVVFELALPNGAANITTEAGTGAAPRSYAAERTATGLPPFQPGGGPPGEFNSSATPSLHFPSWRYTGTALQSSTTGYLEWNGRFSNDGNNWGTALNQFVGGQTGGPLVLFPTASGSAAVMPAVVVGPLDHFKSTILGLIPEYGSQPGMRLAAGVQGYVVNIDPGYVQRVVVTQSDGGIASAVQRFGGVLRREWNTSRLTTDPNVNQLSYWTDNGAWLLVSWGPLWPHDPSTPVWA